jgi:hypothetical protein
LPNRYPLYQTCRRRFQHWVRCGVLKDILADPRLPRLDVTSLSARVERDLARFRGAAWLLGAAALLALFLTGVGTYGLLSSFVTRGLPEIGCGWRWARRALASAPPSLPRRYA